MDWLVIIVVLVTGTVAVSGWKMYRLKKEVHAFADRVEKALDNIISGQGLGESEEEEKDTLWGKCGEKFSRVNRIWQKKEETSLLKKSQMEKLVSDISHQTKTPIANIKLYVELLEDETLSDKGAEFLENLKGQMEKLVVMLSLAAGMAVFLCVTTLIDSQDSREFSYNYRNLDMVLTNDTMTKEKKEERIQIFDQSIIQKLDSVKGVTGVDSVIYAEITVPWEPEFADKWMREFYETWMEIPYEDDIEEYKQYPENFGSSLVGITDADFRELNETLEEPIDESSFLSGKTCLLYQDHLSFDNSDVVGQIVTCAQYEDQDNTRSSEIAGLVDINDYTVLLGYPPTIIVSDKVVKGFVDDPIIAKVGIRYEEEYNEEVETALLSVMNDSSYAKDYSYSSKIELMKNVKKAQGNMMEVGIGIVLILALIGIMNYINTSVGSIQSRHVEISIMESVGMTGKQVKQMLVVEGMIYAGGAWLITMTVGLGVTFYLYQSLNYYKAAFEIPILPVLAAVALTIFVCISVPIIAYRQLERRSAIVERIKGAD